MANGVDLRQLSATLDFLCVMAQEIARQIAEDQLILFLMINMPHRSQNSSWQVTTSKHEPRIPS